MTILGVPCNRVVTMILCRLQNFILFSRV